MALEQVLFVHKELDVYRIPPRAGASGWRSGEWRVSDRIFTGRCRVVATGEALEVRLEDANSGELFGVAPVPPGQAHIAVEQASDSSRNFVLRLEDAASRRHAFVGISFAERATAFDFNVAISDHERQQRRAAEMERISAADDKLAAAQASAVLPEAAALYKPAGDLSLKEGETIKITVRKKEGAAPDGDSFLARLGHAPGSSSSSSAAAGGGLGKLMPLAPPPGQPAATLLPPPLPSQPAGAGAAPASSSAPAAAGMDLLGFDAFAAPYGSSNAPPASSAPAQAQAAPEGWAVFE